MSRSYTHCKTAPREAIFEEVNVQTKLINYARREKSQAICITLVSISIYVNASTLALQTRMQRAF